jgi:hypothetical protein
MSLKPTARFTLLGAVVLATVGYALVSAQEKSSASGTMPVFQVDPAWPRLPNNWVVGVVSAVNVDRHDNVWILHRPRSVPEGMKDRSAPAVLEFNANGQFVTGWGGSGQGYDWPDTEHGIFVDSKENVWITGSGATSTPAPRSDDMVIKFTTQGKFIMQIGARTQNHGNADTKNLRQPADVFVYSKTNEAFFADGYGNRRVIVFNADTGAFKRMWGAFGNKPEDAPPNPSAEPGAARGRGAQAPAKLETEGPGPQQFGTPVHSVKVSNDDFVYVADRSNRRVQVFTLDGKYVKQGFVNRTGPSPSSVCGLAFSPDREQQFLYVADYGNSHIAVLNRKTLEVLYQFGFRSESPGNFRGPHHLAVDSKGNLYVAEVAPGNRAQKFLYKGTSATPPPNALTPAQLSAASH